MNYEKAWKKLYERLKGLSELTNFHGLRFKSPPKLLVTTILKWMDECLEGEK